MSYQTYITEAVVIGSYASNTADMSYRLFTKRGGMIYANARSAREERSKQRYAMQDFSRVSVSLVKGKSGWRIGSVDVFENYYATADSRAARGSVVKLTKVLRRFVHGEEPDPDLYDEFTAALTFLSGPTVTDRSAFDTLCAVRLLERLGYVAPTPAIIPMLEQALPAIPAELLMAVQPDLQDVLSTAQEASHLPK
jgi:DNA repair protein RecO